VYQPAGKPLGGTSIDLSVRRPRGISAESTPITAIWRRTGMDLARYEVPGLGARVVRVVGVLGAVGAVLVVGG
jgi:hypothetical protein